jgi:tetratricopeptide (TPR) repeat protein
MNKAIPLVTLSVFLCACASHSSTQKTGSIQGLTPQEAAAMNSKNAKITDEKPPTVTADVRFAAGQLAESRGDIPGAEHQYFKALDLNPNHLPSLFQLAVIYASQKDYQKSIETWKRYIAASGDQGFGYGNLGFCYELAGMPNRAEDSYKKGIDKDPKNGSCRTNYGIFLARQGKIQEAVRMWDPVLSDAQIHYNLASVFQSNGRKAEAKSEYQKALDADPTLVDARARLAELDQD